MVSKASFSLGAKQPPRFSLAANDRSLFDLCSRISIAKDRSCNRCAHLRSFFVKVSNLEVLAAASVEEVAQLLQPLGLAFRADRLCCSAKLVIEKYGGSIPALEEELLLLPGIGKYTARSICANAFGQSAAVLDTNVARIFERFFGLQGERVKSRCKILWAAADAIAPKREVSRWNLALLDFGALVCIARKPHCSQCPLQQKCCYWVEAKS